MTKAICPSCGSGGVDQGVCPNTPREMKMHWYKCSKWSQGCKTEFLWSHRRNQAEAHGIVAEMWNRIENFKLIEQENTHERTHSKNKHRSR